MSDDKAHITWFSFEGEFVCDYPTFLYGRPSQATIEAMMPSRVLRVTGQQLEQFFNQNMETMKLRAMIDEHILSQFRSTRSFLTHPTLQRKAQQIFDEQANMDSTLPLPKGDAAHFVKDILALYPGRYIVLDFWAMWCAPCKAEIMATKEFRHRLQERSDVKFVFLANKRNPNCEDYLAFVRENLEGEENIAIDDNRFHQLQELFGFNAIPFNVTLTPDGRIVRDGLLLRAAEAGFDRFILMLEEMKARLEE